jgi:uncharacterized membrane protein YbhN (UPF0104 family)
VSVTAVAVSAGTARGEPSPQAAVDAARPALPTRRWMKWAVGAAIGAGIAYTAVFSASSFADALDSLAEARFGWAAVGVACEAASFLLLGLLVHRLLGAEAGVSRRATVGVGLVLTGLGNVLPAAPAEGLALASGELHRRGVQTRRVRLALAFSEWYTTRAAFALVAINAVVIAAIVQFRAGAGLARLGFFGLAGAGVLGVLALTAWLASRRQTAEWIAVAIGRLRFWKPAPSRDVLRAAGAAWWSDAQEVLGNRRNRITVVLVAAASIACDALCFGFALWAVGVHPRPGELLLVYGAAMIASLVPLLPDGLGTVETVVPLLLHHSGTPFAVGLAAVLVYRAIATVLPAAAGALSLGKLRLSTVRVSRLGSSTLSRSALTSRS